MRPCTYLFGVKSTQLSEVNLIHTCCSILRTPYWMAVFPQTDRNFSIFVLTQIYCSKRHTAPPSWFNLDNFSDYSHSITMLQHSFHFNCCSICAADFESIRDLRDHAKDELHGDAVIRDQHHLTFLLQLMAKWFMAGVLNFCSFRNLLSKLKKSTMAKIGIWWPWAWCTWPNLSRTGFKSVKFLWNNVQ